jgi:hypothetical protein
LSIEDNRPTASKYESALGEIDGVERTGARLRAVRVAAVKFGARRRFWRLSPSNESMTACQPSTDSISKASPISPS